MTTNRIVCASIAICGTLVFWPSPAHADYFTSWVATTCDPHSGRAIVRFGYADADDPPLFFVQAEPSFDGGMSAIPVTNASKEQATCKLSSKREVKIRRSEGDEFSIWVDGVRIAHDQMDIDKLPFEFIIDREGFRRCTFQIPSGDIYDVTSAAQKAHPTPIHCDPVSTPISGSVDRVEYPANPHSKRPETGSIVVARADASFCQELIFPAPPNANFKFYIDVPEKLGNIVDADEWGSPMYLLPQYAGGTTHVSTVLFDFWDNGQKVPVYLFNSGHTFDTEFAVVPDPGATNDEVLRMASSASDWQGLQQAARAKGWSVYTSAGTPYDEQEQIGIRLARINNATYLLYGASRGSDNDPTTVLMKAQPGGKLTTVCEFKEVRAHF
jgi:hypothetical protein